MRCQESQIMCAKRKAYAAYKPSQLVGPRTNKMESSFLLDSCGRSQDIMYIQAIMTRRVRSSRNSYCSWMASKGYKFPFHGREFLQGNTLEKRKGDGKVEKQGGINNCGECGMFNGTLGLWIGFLDFFSATQTGRSWLVLVAKIMTMQFTSSLNYRH